MPAPVGTTFRIHLPVEGSGRAIAAGDPGEAALTLADEPEARPEELHAVGDV